MCCLFSCGWDCFAVPLLSQHSRHYSLSGFPLPNDTKSFLGAVRNMHFLLWNVHVVWVFLIFSYYQLLDPDLVTLLKFSIETKFFTCLWSGFLFVKTLSPLTREREVLNIPRINLLVDNIWALIMEDDQNCCMLYYVPQMRTRLSSSYDKLCLFVARRKLFCVDIVIWDEKRVTRSSRCGTTSVSFTILIIIIIADA